jgi:molybdopterin-guanine dinucleotide biosynthesis protein A
LKDSDHTDPLFGDITGVILAGGESRRYGRNKALEKINGIPLIEMVIGVMQSVFRHLILITNTPDQYSHLKLPMHEDLVKGLGPIGGISTALTAIPDDAAFLVACDMPFLNRKLIRYMVENRSDFDVVVPRVSGKMESLHAVYAKQCLPAIRKLLDSHEYQVIRIFSEVSVRYIEENEIRGFDPELKSFLNINEPQELRRLNNP